MFACGNMEYDGTIFAVERSHKWLTVVIVGSR